MGFIANKWAKIVVEKSNDCFCKLIVLGIYFKGTFNQSTTKRWYTKVHTTVDPALLSCAPGQLLEQSEQLWDDFQRAVTECEGSCDTCICSTVYSSDW